MKVRRIDAILIHSSNPHLLATFYCDSLGIPLREERHGMELHWGCDLEGLHFAIHKTAEAKGGNVAVSFEVDDVDGAIHELHEKGVKIIMQPTSMPFGRLASLLDPDGNPIYLHSPPSQ